MSTWTRKVLVLHYVFNDDDFLMKQNDVCPSHLSYLRRHSDLDEGKIEFKAAESLKGKSFYWPPTTTQDATIQFMLGDPYHQERLVYDSIIYPYSVIERS